MDSLTQIALGASVGEAVMVNRVGRKATLWGAILGTLPDLDVLIPLGDAVRDFTYHRGASHALFFMALSAPIFLWLILKIHPQTKAYKWRWLVLISLTLFTHAVLDSFTVYGTQMYLPFSNYPVGWSTIFVIDPLYTLPLLLGVTMLFIIKSKPKIAHKFNLAGIVISCLYLAWSIGIKSHVEEVAHSSLKIQNINTHRLLSVPSPFNTMLWRVIAMTDSGYAEGFYSIFDENKIIKFQEYDSQNNLLDDISELWAVQRLQWFSKGFYKVELVDNRVVISDLRMGVEPLYFFSFSVGKISGARVVESEIEKLDQNGFDMRSSLIMLWRRIWNQESQPMFSK